MCKVHLDAILTYFQARYVSDNMRHDRDRCAGGHYIGEKGRVRKFPGEGQLKVGFIHLGAITAAQQGICL